MDIDNIIEEIRKELRGFGENIVYIKAMIENNNKSSEMQLEKIEEKIKVLINGEIKEVEAITENNVNYIKLRDIQTKNINIGYENKMPTITTV